MPKRSDVKYSTWVKVSSTVNLCYSAHIDNRASEPSSSSDLYLAGNFILVYQKVCIRFPISNGSSSILKIFICLYLKLRSLKAACTLGQSWPIFKYWGSIDTNKCLFWHTFTNTHQSSITIRFFWHKLNICKARTWRLEDFVARDGWNIKICIYSFDLG